MIRGVHPGSDPLDPDLDFYPSRMPDPGVKKAPDPGSRIRNTPWKCCGSGRMSSGSGSCLSLFNMVEAVWYVPTELDYCVTKVGSGKSIPDPDPDVTQIKKFLVWIWSRPKVKSSGIRIHSTRQEKFLKTCKLPCSKSVKYNSGN
jgi:hypothetical protein